MRIFCVSSTALPAPPRHCALRVHWTDRLAHVALAAVALLLLAFLAAPLAAILLKSLQDGNEQWVGLKNFIDYARTPALLESLWNSLWVSALVTAITVPAAFGFAYALTRSRMRFKRAAARHHADPAAGAVAAVGHLADLLVRQPGRAEVAGSASSASSRSTAHRASCWPRSSRSFRMR